MNSLFREGGFSCKCGKHPLTDVKEVSVGHGALRQLPELVRKYGGRKPFLIADRNTYQAAGEKVESLLKEQGIDFSSYIYPQEHLEPDEFAVGQATMNFDKSCDFIVAVGSGTINDISKIIAMVTDLPFIIVGTAPSMDGFASNTSSMISNGVKITLQSACPVAILADLDIVCQAPKKMLQAGLGDMLAKYVSICEWRISNLINGEYYCEEVASLVRRSLKRCIESIEAMESGDSQAVENVIEGLILSGVAMGFAGISRPASGIEHYFSHIWDMRSLEFQTNSDLHGIQVGIGTVLALKIYSQVVGIKPNKAKALKYAEQFDHEKHNDFMREFLGTSAENLILLEKKEGKYDKDKHRERLDIILAKWQEILNIIDEELPTTDEVVNLLTSLEAPVDPSALGFTKEDVRKALMATKDIRDKYSVSRLLWDLGMLEELADVCQF
ncbi:MAG: sn-glycerol-1-phosphate dehydrogenase [Clostridiales bacterium]|nr:sn-glycerol-1-phosphate dehydrogenase [Clostridiales bacterium]